MATQNYKWFSELSAKYNVTVQPIKFNQKTIHVAVINGKRYTCLAQYTKQGLDDFFKSIVNGEVKQDNTVVIKNNGSISLNGVRYDMLDVVKDMEYSRICALIGDYKMNGEEWQVELANKITEWFKNGGLIQWLEYQYQKEYGVTVDEYLMEDSKELVEV